MLIVKSWAKYLGNNFKLNPFMDRNGGRISRWPSPNLSFRPIVKTKISVSEYFFRDRK